VRSTGNANKSSSRTAANAAPLPAMLQRAAHCTVAQIAARELLLLSKRLALLLLLRVACRTMVSFLHRPVAGRQFGLSRCGVPALA
jgi:hypothetical protein